MDRSWLLAAATGGGGPPLLAGLLLDRDRPIRAAVAFGYGDGSWDMTVTRVDDAAAGVVAVDFVDRGGERRARAFLNIDRDGVLLRLVAVFDTVDHATRENIRHVFVVSSVRRPDPAAPAPAPLLLGLPPAPAIHVDYIVIDIPDNFPVPDASEHGSNAGDDEEDVPPVGANQLAAGGGHNVADDGDAQEYLPPLAEDQLAVGGGNNRRNINDQQGVLIEHVNNLVAFLVSTEGIVELNDQRWSHVRTMFTKFHERLPEEHQLELEDLLVERRMEQIRRSKGRMMMSFACNVTVSFLSHWILFLLSMRFTESGSSDLATAPAPSAAAPAPPNAREPDQFLIWGIEKIAAPTLMMFVVWAVKSFVIRQEFNLMAYRSNDTANFLLNSLSKISFFAVKEFPLLCNRILWGHTLSFAVDFVGAIFLLFKNGFWDQDIADG
ncbi:hypothetical protein CFC21_026501 [Triticum aestivum]|uniref:Uncharacterized protein n=2 Tax=Triticum aestivum TaxID=4565 RepID=A0A9R1JCZ6_WHEAT|nr:uncharacterized protein LOC123047399 [Triticum aestivum]KAF7012292.1 hypothetical protein CFC21_026501 [Triticum aestivum]